ncbi:MAG: GAF domain-containing protein [Clostridia bacterium]|nr:GAF domain-containing protein [Clostridia bacterium]
MTPNELKRFLNICLAISNERDREALLSNILDTAMDLAKCDAGTLYLYEDDGLHFCRMVTRSQNIRQGGHAAPIALPPVPLDETYVCSWVAIHGEAINVADVRTDKHFDFSGSKRYDDMTGYRTKSMLVVPMCNDKGQLVGVTQLINALDEDGEITTFPQDIELLVGAISSQAAISITNMQYSDQITALLDSLVGALSAAIDASTPYNANHTRNMVKYGANFLDWLEKTDDPWKFDADKRRTFLLSVWLHDVGKLAVPLSVMNKNSRLGDGIEKVMERFKTIGLLNKIAMLEGRISSDEFENVVRGLNDAKALVERIDAAGFLKDEDLEQIDALSKLTYTDENGGKLSWITREEYDCLSIRKGTLTAEERSVMESHVSITARILSQVDFPKMYAEAPHWAAAHHELLNGSGYPAHLTADDIPDEVRLLTILDVFDALTARDRPYKPPMPSDKAFSILHSMVGEGAIDEKILELFETSKAWEAE